MAKPWAISFYNSKAWQDLRWARILQENFRCQDCGEDYTLNPAELIGHHMVTLTPGNIQDKNVAMNPRLIKIVCKKCHDKEHHRFGQRTAQNVFLVYGPPLSGKKTLVNQLAERGRRCHCAACMISRTRSSGMCSLCVTCSLTRCAQGQVTGTAHTSSVGTQERLRESSWRPS